MRIFSNNIVLHSFAFENLLLFIPLRSLDPAYKQKEVKIFVIEHCNGGSDIEEIAKEH